MKVFQHKFVLSAIASLAIFSIVSPVYAESVEIHNTVSSHASTGGQGEDGQDGENGKDGANGKNGQDGQSGTVINGDGKATVHVKTSVNGQVVVDEFYTNNQEDKTETTKNSNGEEITVEANATSSIKSYYELLDLLDRIRLILANYVTNIF